MTVSRIARVGTVAVAAGIVYVLSPLTVWFAVAIVPVVAFAVRGLEPDERRVVLAVLVAAIALRLAAILALFLTTNHSAVPFGSFFADEDYFIKRALWLRNLALGQELHRFDLEYAFEPYGSGRYLYFLAFVQATVGPAPYGLHLIGVLSYLSASLLLYRQARTAYGPMPALFGLVVLLFLPSLFAWSISVLKEPTFMLVCAVAVVVAAALPGEKTWRRRSLAFFALLVLAATLEGVRPDGTIFLLGASLGALTIAFVIRRPALMLGTIAVAPAAAALVLRQPQVQLRVYAAIQSAARQHWGAVVVSRGHGYQLLDSRFYTDLNSISSLEFLETVRYLVRAIVSWVLVPVPWDAPSLAAVAYIPEQVVWYVLVALAVAGLLPALRRNTVTTLLLVAFAIAAAAVAAFTGGNVGTLVRHRGLAFPFIVWLSGVGACELFAAMRRAAAPGDAGSHGALEWRPI